jgi:hypothetical protein
MIKQQIRLDKEGVRTVFVAFGEEGFLVNGEWVNRAKFIEYCNSLPLLTRALPKKP